MAEIELIKGANNGNVADKLSAAYPKINRNFQRMNTELEVHGQNITNHEGRILSTEGSINIHTGQIYEALAKLLAQDSRITNLIVNAGDSGPEARDARVSGPTGITYLTLKARLDGEMSNLMNYLNYMPINGGDFDGNDPSGPVIDGGTY